MHCHRNSRAIVVTVVILSPARSGCSSRLASCAARRSLTVAEPTRAPLPEETPFRTKSAAVPTTQSTREKAPGEDAMKLRKILFSFEGRIGRGTYWLAILALIVALLVLTFAPFLLNSEETAVLLV